MPAETSVCRPTPMRRWATAITLLLAATLMAACGDDDGNQSARACGSGGPLSGPGGDLNGPYLERSVVDADGAERTWLLRLPAGYREGVRSDVVFNLHGSGSNAVAQLAYGDFSEQADRDNVIVVVPNAGKTFPDRGHTLAGYWDGAWEANLRVRDIDIDMIHDLVEQLRDEYCTGDFYATGMSAGGDAASALACLSDTPFKAFGPVTYAYYNSEECADAPPRPIVYFHGTDDFVVPFAGSQAPWFDPPVPKMMQRWATHNGCQGNAIEERISDEVLRYSWAGCAAPTSWYLVEGGGHTWPGAIPVEALGHTTDDISASDIIWDLFFN